MLGRLVAAAVCVAGAVSAQEAREPVDLELVLLADASGSIDDVGDAAAAAGLCRGDGGPAGPLGDRERRRAGAGSRSPTSNGRGRGRRTWWSTGRSSTARRAPRRSPTACWRRRGRRTGTNAIGAALLKGLELIDGNGFEGWRKVIDLSGDSIWNPRPPTHRRGARRRDRAGGRDERPRRSCAATARAGRASAISSRTSRDRLIVGAGAFVVTADGAQAFAAGGPAQADPRDRRAARRGSHVHSCPRLTVAQISVTCRIFTLPHHDIYWANAALTIRRAVCRPAFAAATEVSRVRRRRSPLPAGVKACRAGRAAQE